MYAHISKYADKIQEYVKAIQYKKENYETGNLFFKADQFPVKKGEVIAFSGDTGSSGGPHLHFEIRDTSTEHIINPLFFGLKPIDTNPPTFLALKVYPLDQNARINNKNRSTVISLKSIEKGKYKVGKMLLLDILVLV